jgi:hypothetical protein
MCFLSSGAIDSLIFWLLQQRKHLRSPHIDLDSSSIELSCVKTGFLFIQTTVAVSIATKARELTQLTLLDSSSSLEEMTKKD